MVKQLTKAKAKAASKSKVMAARRVTAKENTRYSDDEFAMDEVQADAEEEQQAQGNGEGEQKLTESRSHVPSGGGGETEGAKFLTARERALTGQT